jgi:TonB family protein
MYDAWDQPPDLQNKLVATIVLRVARDGSVADVTLQRSSGDKTMDRSVLAAARKVPRLDPPPDILVKDSYATVSVNFRKEG